ncbi:hypothetical protein ACEQ8H_003281 [Pleosporales sp. CAS-2024a]
MTSRFPTVAEYLSFPAPNYVDPVTRMPLALAVVVPMTVLVAVFISVRFYCRTVLIRTLGWDDWTMLAAAVLSMGSNIMILISMLPEYQMGYHLWDIYPSNLYGKMRAAQASSVSWVSILFMGMSTQLLFTVIITLIKVAILMTYLRESTEKSASQSRHAAHPWTGIFPSKTNKWFCCIMIFYTVSLNFACFFVTLFQCAPASTYWEIFKHMETAKCLNIKVIYYFHSGQNTFSDFVIFLWPAKHLVNVQISPRQRITLTCMFCLGVIVCIAGIVRLYFTHLYLISYDAFWYGGTTLIIMAVETGVGVACGCLPACKPLMNRVFPRIFAAATEYNRYPRRGVPAANMTPTSRASTAPASIMLGHADSARHPGTDTIITEFSEKPRTGMPVAPPPSRLPHRHSYRYGVLDHGSDTDSDMIILQRRSDEHWPMGQQKV